VLEIDSGNGMSCKRLTSQRASNKQAEQSKKALKEGKSQEEQRNMAVNCLEKMYEEQNFEESR